MYTFEQLNEKVTTLLLQNTDVQKCLFLQNLQKQIIIKQTFYNSIPDNIKTTNTLRYIIESLTFNLNQFNYKQISQYNIINTNFEEDACIDTSDTINIAYLTRKLHHGTTLDTQITALKNIRDTLQQKLDISESNVILLKTQLENIALQSINQ